MQKKYLYKIHTKKTRKNIYLKYNSETKGIGFYQLRSLENIFLIKENFESIRRLLSRKLKKKSGFFLKKNSNKIPTFKKPLKVRMGSGRGGFNIWLWKFHKFQKIFEISFFKKYFLLKKYLKKIKHKIPCKTFLTSYI